MADHMGLSADVAIRDPALIEPNFNAGDEQ